jgi:hypothetical protein
MSLVTSESDMMARVNPSEIALFLIKIIVCLRNYISNIEHFQYYLHLGTFCSEAVLLLIHKDI